MSAAVPDLGREIARRHTFAIISHPDDFFKDSPGIQAVSVGLGSSFRNLDAS